MYAHFPAIALAALLAACTSLPPADKPCPPCQADQAPSTKPAAAPLQAAQWRDLPGWAENDPTPAWTAFRASCAALNKQPALQALCREPAPDAPAALRAWMEERMQPWRIVNPDGSTEGLITGYYEPILRGARKRGGAYQYPAYAPPPDLIEVDLSALHPELKNLRLRGRIEGRKLVPYWTRAQWLEQERGGSVLAWLDNALDVFFMEIQGSGQVVLNDGARIRLNYADQNGQPFRSIGRWLIEQGELKSGEASMQGIKAWAKAHPARLREMMEVNPSLVFFREISADGPGPTGALGVPLTPQASIAIDPRVIPLGAPVWLATSWPNERKPLRQLMLAQDTGGAIRGAVRADFYWGSGAKAGELAGRMSQQGAMWLLMPRVRGQESGGRDQENPTPLR